MYTRHGHQIDGTIVETPLPEKVARCGGPGLCAQCSIDASSAPKEKHTENTLFIVQRVLHGAGLNDHQVLETINEFQNAGILFRERA